MGGGVRRYIDILIIITFPYSTCVSSFFGSSIPTSLFFKCIFVLVDNRTSRRVYYPTNAYTQYK